MIKKICVGIAVVMGCASVIMASTIVTTETTTPTGTIHVPTTPAGGTIVAGGVIDNFDAARNAGTWNYGETAGGSMGEGTFGNYNPAPHGTEGVQADDPGATAGQYGYMYSGDTLGAIAATLNVPLQPTSFPMGNNILKTSTYIAFDLNQSTTPSLVQLFLTDGNGGAWYTTITLGAASTWNSYLVWLDPARETWYDQGQLPVGAESTFARDINNIGDYYLGLNILYPDSHAGTYNIDNFEMGRLEWPEANPAVPEPGTMSMLGFALASMGLTFRRRVRLFFKR